MSIRMGKMKKRTKHQLMTEAANYFLKERFNDDEEEMDNEEMNDDTEESVEPEENDCFITDNPSGGYEVSCGGVYNDSFSEFDDALAAVNEWQKESNFYPNIWMVSDHGNYTLIDKDGNEIE